MTILEELSPEEMQLVLDLLEDATRISDEEEVEVHRTMTCLLCTDTVEDSFMAKEVTYVSKLGEVKHTTLVTDNGDRPPIHNFEYTTHRSVCPVCTPRLKRLTKGQLVALVLKFARLTGYEAQRRGVACDSDTSEIKRR